MVKSFDPGERGWMSAGQIRRAYATLGLTPTELTEDRVPTSVVLENLVQDQKTELLDLLSAGAVYAKSVPSEDSFTFWNKNKN